MAESRRQRTKHDVILIAHTKIKINTRVVAARRVEEVGLVRALCEWILSNHVLYSRVPVWVRTRGWGAGS